MSKAVITFGRLNPPTIGHQKLIDKVKSEAKKRGAMPHVYLSHSQDKKKNPLDYNTKVRIAKKAFGPSVTKSKARNIIEVLKELEKMGHTEVTIVVGSDRVKEFLALSSKYNGKEYNFDKIEAVSAGNRDPDAEDVSGMSASKMRAAAQAGDYDLFKNGTPTAMSEKDKKFMYDKIRSEMGISEAKEIEISDDDFEFTDAELQRYIDVINIDSLDEEDELNEEFEIFLEEVLLERNPLTVQQRLAIGRRMKRLQPRIKRRREMLKKRMATPAKLEVRARKAAIKLLRKKFAGKQGQNYASLSPSSKISVDRIIQKKMGMIDKIAKRLLPKIRKAEQERLKRVRGAKNESVDIDVTFEKFITEEYIEEKALEGIKNKAEKSGISYSILKKVFDRGMGAWETSHRPGTTPQQWAYARVNSFITGGKTRTTADADLWKQAKDRKQGVQEITLAKLKGKIIKAHMSSDKRNELIRKVKEKGYAAVASVYGITPRELQAIVVESLKLDEKVAQSQIDQLEKFADRILAKYDIDVEFTRHFVDRLNDPRNNPEIKVAELQKFFKKIQKNKGKDIKSNPDTQVVLKDLTTNLNLPVVINYKDGEFEVVNKTIMRKKDFKTPDKTIQYENAVAAAREKIKREKEADKAKHDTMLDRARLQTAQDKNRATRPTNESSLEEGINDPAIFKAVFLAGGPGSGKSFVVQKTGLASMGFVVINSDDIFERALKKAGLSSSPEDIFSVQGQELRGGAKTLTAKKQENVLKGRLGIVVDGTGRDHNKIQKQSQTLKEIGYDVAMIFVNTDMNTALERNRQRERTLPDDTVEKMWKDVQKNMGKFQRSFGQNFKIVDNSMDSNFKDEIQSAYKMMSKFAKKEVTNQKAKKWISQEKKKRGINESFESFLETLHDKCGTPDCCMQCDTAVDLNQAFVASISDTMYAKDFEEHKVHDEFALHPSVMEQSGAGEEGTDKLVKKYKKDTPCECFDHIIQEAEYQGRKVELNDPFRLPSDSKKKFGVYAKNEKGNIVMVKFGDPNMEIKRDNPERRKSFRARHSCDDNPGPKWKARYWSCYQWRAGSKVDN